MMKSSIVSVLLVVLCSWLGWTAYEEAKLPAVPSADSRARDVGAKTTRDRGKSEKKITTIVFPPLETLGDIVSRPLFNISRRPITVEKLAPDEKPSELNVMLSGIVIGHTGQIAHLRSAADKQTQALSVGDKIGDWQIQSIFPDRVVLRAGGRVETLYMQKPGARNTGVGRPGAAGAKQSTRRATTKSKRRTRRNYRRSRRRDEQ